MTSYIKLYNYTNYYYDKIQIILLLRLWKNHFSWYMRYHLKIYTILKCKYLKIFIRKKNTN